MKRPSSNTSKNHKETTMDVFNLPVHQSAEAFRMLPEDEMQALSDSIKEHGLNHPLVVTTITSYDEKTGEKVDTKVLVDGRNRREACRRAGVVPSYVELNGADINQFIEAENNLRRHDTKGMRAMSYALRFPEKQQGRRSTSLFNSDVSQQYISQARTVLEYCDTDTVEAVKNGAVTLPVAYEVAMNKKKAKETEMTDSQKLEWVRSVAPDLADKVESSADDESPYLIDDAMAAAKARIERVKAENTNKISSIMHGLKSAAVGLTAFENGDSLSEAVALIKDHNYCKEEMEKYFSEEALEALKNKSEAIMLGAKQVTKFLKEL